MTYTFAVCYEPPMILILARYIVHGYNRIIEIPYVVIYRQDFVVGLKASICLLLEFSGFSSRT